ncbi:hypothetical protein X773_32210 [Mesorhizobium sp. LSJC285A00]|nr:hypothetical protein X773_32210 [Mesorhizobium sp. LSJC285A00]ESW68327.1 hypothetical protein X771_11690 [Mesorhizobium sp. LSJC277A00]ESW84471.1 hypothetical protein X770_24845 [Mesorhizobium sp. LSJC269B00]ESX13838.1 hypothetical protein X766_28700 [Mesorhizobium sp. LSJC255A00]ESX25106.1 hypothetical protein X767_10415 [Mesorhizobium sp. LSJC264A00]ESZ05746.1 hypothetical protein X736_17890 [Mesorhizobium sp. L2C089B000]ESZ11449.1 hypothetical protein X735_25700 [Mesorhizobium sp. L2C08
MNEQHLKLVTSRVIFSSRLISCGSFTVSMTQRIGSVILICLRFYAKQLLDPAAFARC